MTDQQAPERIFADLHCGTWFEDEPFNEGEDAEYIRADLLEAAEKKRNELAAEVECQREITRCERLLTRDLKAALEIKNSRAEKAEAERDQALASSAAREIAMRDRAAERIESIGFSAGLIRSLPLSPDATAALNEMLADAWDKGRLSSALDRNPYRKGAT